MAMPNWLNRSSTQQFTPAAKAYQERVHDLVNLQRSTSATARQ